jgi:DNA-binding NtrC family response regulator
MCKVLIVDDEEKIRNNFSEILNVEGISTREASCGSEALKAARSQPPSAVLLDLKLPDMSGIEILKELKKIDPDIPIIMVTAHGDIPTAVESIKYGAYDFITKPPDLNELVMTIKKAIDKYELEKKFKEVNKAYHTSLEFILGNSDAIKNIIDQLQQISSSDYNVIIQGETGTGKTYLANIIHNMSKRSNNPFVKVSIGSIPETLVESELFGFEKGAFTGADRTKKGYFEIAHEGTLFIDDLDNATPFVQGKLLSVVEDKKVYHIGSTRPFTTDIRIISATNTDLIEDVKQKKFREDLFFRIGEFIVHLPPLRKRLDDITFFSKKFLMETCAELKTQTIDIQDNTMEILKRYPWPGNLRELRSVIKKAVIFSDKDLIKPEHIQFILDDKSKLRDVEISPVLTLKEAAKNAEKKTIINALEMTKGNKTKAAKFLNITYRSLLSKTKEFGI